MFLLATQQLCSLITLFCTVHFFGVAERLRRESASFHFFGGQEHKETTSSFFS